jgi:hypothetical protein
MFWRFIQITGAYAGFILCAFAAGGVYKHLTSPHPDHELVRLGIVVAIISFGLALGILFMYLGNKTDQLRQAIERQSLRR